MLVGIILYLEGMGSWIGMWHDWSTIDWDSYQLHCGWRSCEDIDLKAVGGQVRGNYSMNWGWTKWGCLGGVWVWSSNMGHGDRPDATCGAEVEASIHSYAQSCDFGNPETFWCYSERYSNHVRREEGVGSRGGEGWRGDKLCNKMELREFHISTWKCLDGG